MTFPLVMGAVTYFLALIWGDPLIRALHYFGLGKHIRERGDEEVVGRHKREKEGTPTFGGVLIIVPAVATTLLVNLANVLRGTTAGRSTLMPLVGLVLFGLLGGIDDWEGIIVAERRGEGISGWLKIGAQFALAVAIVAVIFFFLDIHSVALPTVPFRIDLGYVYFPIGVFIILATSNAANLTDGLDGLAGNVAWMAFASYGIIAFLQGQLWLSIFCFIMVGCLFGFLWFNAHPARVFMGDTGSQAIGAALGIVALMSGQWLLLPLIASIFMIETISVILQKAAHWYGLRFYGEKKRIFKMAPIHHHFEVLGWSEVQIVFRFFFINMITGILGIALAIL